MPKNILLVEDDPGIADPLQMALRREGWQVIWHSTVEQAARLLQQPVSLDAVIEFKRRVYEQALNELARFLHADQRRPRAMHGPANRPLATLEAVAKK